MTTSMTKYTSSDNYVIVLLPSHITNKYFKNPVSNTATNSRLLSDIAQIS